MVCIGLIGSFFLALAPTTIWVGFVVPVVRMRIRFLRVPNVFPVLGVVAIRVNVLCPIKYTIKTKNL